MKKVLKSVLSLLLVFLLVSCNSAMPSTNESTGTGNNVQNLVIGTTAENNVFHIMKQSDAFGRLNYNGLTQGNFVYRDENGNVKPYFWKEFSISEDGKEIEFKIPLDAVFHDGQKVTMDDLVFTLTYMRDVLGVGGLKSLTEVKVISEDTAKMIFADPDAYFWINTSALNNACVFPKHIWEGTTSEEDITDERAAIGCGPYKLVDKDTDAQVSHYEAVPENNFLGDLTVDSVTLKSYSDENALMMAMVSGEVDAMFNYANPIDAPIIDSIKGEENIDLGQSPFSGQYQIEYGKYRAPGNDFKFREAVSYALNYEQLAVTINGEYGKVPGRGIISPTAKGHDSSLPKLEYNPEKSKQILEEAGYKDIDNDGFREFIDGKKMEIKITPQYNSKMDIRMRIAEVIIKNLQDIGIKAVIDSEAIVNADVWESNMTKGNFDISMTFTTSGMAVYSSAFRYFLGELQPGEKSWIWGTTTDKKVIDAFYGMTKAVSEEDYNNNAKLLQKYASEDLFAQALAWETAFFPYRTDKYEGWKNYPSWGVINSETWFLLKNK